MTNGDGTSETQELFLLPKSGELPGYIDTITYRNAEIEDTSDALESMAPPINVEMGDEMPIELQLNSENQLDTANIVLLHEFGDGDVSLQIYDNEQDLAILDITFPVTISQVIGVEEGKVYSVALRVESETSIDGFFGNLSVTEGNAVISSVWAIQTDKSELAVDDFLGDTRAVTKYESEPNNSTSNANIYNNDEDMYGAINSVTDVDYYKVYFGRDGKANFFLGNIPTGCNYDMKVYSQPKAGGSITLYRTLSTTGKDFEMATDVPVENDKVYYMQVYPVGAKYNATARYQVRAKITPSDDNYENNNTFLDAKPISYNGYIYATLHTTKDVDYYYANPSSGVLTVTLSSIPSGCNYRVAVYDGGQRLLGETTASGSSDKIVNVAVPSGKCYIKVYTVSGSSQAANYRLTLNTRTATTTVSGLVNPLIQPAGGSGVTTTPIASLPIQMVCTKRGSTTQYTLNSNILTTSTGNFSITGTLPSDADKLYIKLYADDSSLSVQLLDGTIASFLFEVPISASNVSFSLGSYTLTNQLKASMSLWRLAKNALTAMSNNRALNHPKLLVRCTAGVDQGTNANGSRVLIDGGSQYLNYYDYDILLHEMGHWQMDNHGGFPAGSGIGHGYGTPSNPGTSYSEGWAHYFSCTMRKNSYIRDYDSSGNYFGANLQNGQVKTGYTSSFTSLSKLSPYETNANLEANVGTCLWNLSSSFGTDYAKMESYTTQKPENWAKYYALFTSPLIASDRERAWNTCEKYNVAYDMVVPTVRLSVSGMTASMNATDDVAVKTYEWYVDGVLRSSGNTTSSSLNLGTFGLSAGAHTVECRAYDPEGLAVAPRPRIARYGSASTSFVVAAGANSANKSIAEQPALHLNFEDTAVLSQTSSALEVGSVHTMTATAPGKVDISINAAISGAVKSIVIFAPSGEVFAEVNYIAPDAPITIPDAAAGNWTIQVESFSAEELLIIAQEQNLPATMSLNTDVAPTQISLAVTAAPSPVIIDFPATSNNPFILKTLSLDSDVDIFENGQIVDVNMPMLDGTHTLTMCRSSQENVSEPITYIINIDTVAPIIEVADVPSETQRDRFVLSAKFSEPVAEMTVNGISMELGSCDSSSFCDYFLLTPGVNEYSIAVTDSAGNCSTRMLNVIRVA